MRHKPATDIEKRAFLLAYDQSVCETAALHGVHRATALRWKKKFIKEGVLDEPAPARAPRTHRRRAVRPSAPVPQPQTFAIDGEITEASVESFLLTCMAENPGDPRVANLLISWLDKKSALTPTNNEETNEDNNWARELREIQDAVFR